MIVTIYLLVHFIIQTLYQYDRLCPHLPDCHNDCSQFCREWATHWFERWNGLMKEMRKVITFLVGFYVATNVRRWWEQVRTKIRKSGLTFSFRQIRAIPKPCYILLQFENLMDNITPDEALDLKKKVIRYLHVRYLV